MHTEFLNRIEIQGIVGAVYLNKVGNTSVLRFSVLTEHTYKGNDGSVIVDSTWHNVTCWQGDGLRDPSSINKGDAVNVKGRLRTYRFADSDGNERVAQEIFANSVTKIERRD